MSEFFIPEQRLIELAATRQGRVSIAGFNYQASYAVARLASMLARRSILNLPDFPVRLRYDWGEDLDEACEDGCVVFTQCKRIASMGQPSKLAEVFQSFAPKWLFVPPVKRTNVRFRLVCTDPKFGVFGLLADSISASRAECKKHFAEALQSKPGDRADRRLWQSEADTFGHEALFDALWERCDALYLPQDLISGYPASPLLNAEQKALELLLSFSYIDAAKQIDALSRLRRIVHANLIAFEPTNDAPFISGGLKPRSCERVDIANALASSTPSDGIGLPFDIVDRTFLSEQREKPRRQFVARQPDWADVIHGADETVRFIERSITGEIRDKIVSELLDPIERGTERRLGMLFITGAPGAGKTTLVRRVAALLVEEGKAVIADAGVDSREPAASPDEYFIHLERLAAGGRPVIFLLDDPLYGDSPWVPVLKRLNRPGLRIAVLAPCPQMLFDMHRGSIPFGVLRHRSIGTPTEVERNEMKRLYSRGTKALSNSDEFLVIAMEAAAGVSFDELIRRLWQTLNGGFPIPDHWDSAAITLRAFMAVAFFHRAYVGCPEPILRRVLGTRPGDQTIGGVWEVLARLRSRDGWLMFRFNEQEKGIWNSDGTLIFCAHQRIAQRAWELRPFDWVDIGEKIVEASLSAPRAIRPVAVLAARLCKSADPVDQNFAKYLSEQWRREEHQEQLETRFLCWFTEMLQTNGASDMALQFRDVLTTRAQLRGDGWLAALQLLDLSGDSRAADSFRSGLNMEAIILHADFSIAPNRASKLFSRLSQKAKAHFIEQISKAFDGELSWRPNSALVGWLLRHGRPKDMLDRVRRVEEWLNSFPDDKFVRNEYLAMLARVPPEWKVAFHEHAARAIVQTRLWLVRHPTQSTILTTLCNVFISFSKDLVDQRQDFLKDLEAIGESQNLSIVMRSQFSSMINKLRLL